MRTPTRRIGSWDAAASWKQLGSFALIVTTTMLVSGCIEDDPAKPMSEVAFSLANLPADSIQDVPAMVAIAREVPTFAGVYFDDEGQLVVAMTDVSRGADVERLIRAQLGSHETRAGKRTAATVSVVTRPVQYSFLELVRYKTALSQGICNTRRGNARRERETESRRDWPGRSDCAVARSSLG